MVQDDLPDLQGRLHSRESVLPHRRYTEKQLPRQKQHLFLLVDLVVCHSARYTYPMRIS